MSTPAFSVLLAFCLFAFWNFDQSYRKIIYPRDVLFTFSHAADVDHSENHVIELTKDKKVKVPYCNIHLPYAYYNLSGRRVDPSVFFYNTAILYPIEGQEVVDCMGTYSKVLLRAPYYLCFAPYGYEAYSIAARKRLQSGLYTTQVVLKNPSH